MAHIDARGIRVTSWSDVDFTIPALDALKKCLADEIMCDGKSFFMNNITVGIQGVNYSGYHHVTLKDIINRNAKVIWLDGFSVVWGDEVMDDRLGKGVRYARRLVENLSPEDQKLFQQHYTKTITGWHLPRSY